MASELDYLTSAEAEAAQNQFSTSDYGSVGDQRPYQIVQPAYPAPKFLANFAYLESALRECDTLCRLKGQPFRLVKWGAKQPCYPCGMKARSNQLPSLRVHSPGAIAGFPDAQPIADFLPNGARIAYDKKGRPVPVGAPTYVVSSTPNPFYNPGRPPQRYLEAVTSAQYLAKTTGRPAYLCSSLGADCKQNSGGRQLVPVVYVEPGGLVRRYRSDLHLTGSSAGSTDAVTRVTPEEFRELVRESAGQSRLGWGA
jgi:hypothetical protein